MHERTHDLTYISCGYRLVNLQYIIEQGYRFSSPTKLQSILLEVVQRVDWDISIWNAFW